MNNVDQMTVDGFGDEWTRFDQSALLGAEFEELFQQYFRIFPWSDLPKDAVGFDLGCGSGRWAKGVAPRVGTLHCVDASPAALEVARRALSNSINCRFHHATVDAIPLPDQSMDFGYSLGVLHHVPDPVAGLQSCVKKLKPGAPLLIYLYYAFDSRPAWFRALWQASDLLRRVISQMPHSARYAVSQVMAATTYYPLARAARLFARLGLDVSNFPLTYYRDRSFYVMRTDALDRFGTSLERRFTAPEIRGMMEAAGLERIAFSDRPPFWCAVGFRRADAR